MISGKTSLIAHIGYPTESFKAPMIYNPWFEKQKIDAVVMPMGVILRDGGCRREHCERQYKGEGYAGHGRLRLCVI